MSLHDELVTAQRCLDDLARTVSRLEKSVGPGALEVRRVRTDAEHLRESIALLRESVPGDAQASPKDQVIQIPDQPYDRTLWVDVDDEGLGCSDRHAP